MKLGLILGLSALAGGSLWAQENTLTATYDDRPIPVYRAEAVQRPILEGDQFQLSLRLDPTQQSSYDGFSRQEMIGQNFALAYQMKLTSTLDLTYEIVAGATRGDLWMLTSNTDQSYDTFGVSHKATVAWQASKVFVLHLFAMGGTTMHPDSGGTDTNTQAGADVVWTVWKDGKLGAQGSVGEATPFDKSMLDQEKVGMTFEQKLPWAPLTLQGSSTLAQQQAAVASPDDSVSLKNSGAVQWTIQPGLQWAVGVDDQQSQFSLEATTETLRSYYTQYSLQPDPVWNFTLRTSYDQHAKGPDDAVLRDQSMNFTLGVNLKMSDRFGAGVTLRYRLPDSAARPASTPGETILSISATGLF